ncbi:MAG: carbohydrate porin [Pirellulaceae bacterium]
MSKMVHGTLFGRASISDGNPTPLRYYLSAGLGGNSPLRCDRGDNWGIGWYYVSASDEFGPLPRAIFDPQDGSGVEVFYNFQVTPWLNVTPDVQSSRQQECEKVAKRCMRSLAGAKWRTNHETVFEFVYKAAITPRIGLQPDLQYIVSPSGIHRDALAVGVRLQVVL